MEKITGNMIDISEYLDFTVWDLVWFWDQSKTSDMTDDQ
jgi:hypothetical protein